MKKKNGFTLVEVSVSVALLSVIIIFVINFISLIRNNEDGVAADTALELDKQIISASINADVVDTGKVETVTCTENSCDINFQNGEKRNIKIEENGTKLIYTNKTTNKMIFTRRSEENNQYELELDNKAALYIIRVKQSDKRRYDIELILEKKSAKYLVSEIRKNKTVSTRTDFTTNFEEEAENVIYKTNRTSGRKDVYYYAGNINNNWVIFGDDNMGNYYYWRIIRTNTPYEGGGTRLLFSGYGTSATTIPNNTNSAFIEETPAFNCGDINDCSESGNFFNTSNGSAEFVGYMFDQDEQHGAYYSSNAKKIIDNWYRTGGLIDYADYLDPEAFFCGDRTVESSTIWMPNSQAQIKYGPYIRLIDHKYPSYSCGESITGNYLESYKDSYNKDIDSYYAKPSSGGIYPVLTYPIGLITVDELAFMGGIYNEDGCWNCWYQHEGYENWWTMSPSSFTDENARVFFVEDDSYIYETNVDDEMMLRPVISLKANAEVSSGNGTTSSPYIIKTN